VKLIATIRTWLEHRQSRPVKEWFTVEFDDVNVRMRAAPPGRERWEQSFAWASVRRVCFKDEGLYASDGIYVFTSDRAESYMVPIEAQGGKEFFHTLAARGHFPPEIMLKAVRSTDGGLYCWPPEAPVPRDG